MFKSCQSYSEQSAVVAELADLCIQIKQKYSYSEHDARTIALMNITGLTRNGQMMLNLLDSWAIGDELVRQFIPQIIGLQTVTPEGVKLAADILNKSSRLSFILLVQFQIENCLRSVARELGLSNTSTGFFKTANDVITFLGLPPNRLEILNTPALIRNSLHANGIHHGYHGTDTVTQINGVTYHFLHDQRVQCGSWEHIAHAFKASVNVLDEIIMTPQVSAIPDPIMDQFVWDLLTTPDRA